MARGAHRARAGRRRWPGPAIVAFVAGLLAPAAVTAQAATDIYLLAVERQGEIVVPVGEPVRATDRPGYDNQPYFTATGALLYTSIRGDQADTYRYDPETGRTARVTATPESEYSPTPIPGSDRFSVVRVEADSTQRLWSFALDGTEPRLVLEGVAPVGYHAWVEGRVALFVLGDPPTLQLADPTSGAVRTVAAGIGRSVQRVPGRDAISFTQATDGGWLLREVRVSSGEVRTLAPMLGPDEYHAWMPDGTLLTGHGTEVLRWDTGASAWTPVVDVDRFGLGTVTRLAVAPDGRSLALVVDRPAL